MRLPTTTMIAVYFGLVSASRSYCDRKSWGYESQIYKYECQFCNPGDAGCVPYNATFDERNIHDYFADYDDIWWENVHLENNRTMTNERQLVPYSQPNMLRIPYGKKGFMISNGGGAAVWNFRFGCQRARAFRMDARARPIDCVVRVDASCGTNRKHLVKEHWTFEFNSTEERYAPLAFTNESSWQNFLAPKGGACMNYTFSAVYPPTRSELPVDLFLDDILYKRLPEW